MMSGSAPAPAAPDAEAHGEPNQPPGRRRPIQWLSESFVPLLVVFALCTVALIWADLRAVERSQRAIVIRLGEPEQEPTPGNEEAIAHDGRVRAPLFWAPGAALTSALPAAERPVRRVEADLRARLESAPQQASAWANLLGLKLDRRKQAEAMELVRSLAGSLGSKPAQGKLAKALVAEFPHRTEAERMALQALLFNLGLALERADELPRAWVAYRLAAETGKPHWQLALAQAVVSIRRRRIDAAEQFAASALKHAPADRAAAVHFALANTFSRNQHPGRAKRAYALALQQRPDFAPARLNLAVLQARQGRHREAERQYRALLEARPDYASAHYNLGILLQRTQREREAFDSYGQAVVFRPAHTAARRKLVLLGLTSGKLDTAEEQLEWLRARSPGNAEYAFLQARLRWRQRRLGAAAELYREAVRKRGGDYPEAWVNLGLVLRAQGNDKAAREAYQSAIRLRPDFAAAHYHLGRLLASTKQHEQAVSAFRDALASAPEARSAYRMARSLKALGQDEAYARTLQRTLELEPTHVGALASYGVVLARAGDTKEAATMYRRALAVEPRKASVWLNLGLALGRMPVGPEPGPDAGPNAVLAALRNAERYALDNPRLKAKALRAQGDHHLKHQRFESATEAFRQAVSLLPDDTAGRLGLSRAWLAQGKLDQAKRELDKLLALDQEQREAWQLAEQLAVAQKDREAVRHARDRLRGLPPAATERGTQAAPLPSRTSTLER